MQSCKKSKRIIIGLHGWTGNFASLQTISKLWNLPMTKWIYLQGPYKAEAGGYSWFHGNDKDGWKYKKSFKMLKNTIQELITNGYQHKQIYLLGFSQGACLTMEFLIRQPFSIGGIIPIAGFIKYKSRFKQDRDILSQNTSVLLLHGDKDNIIGPEESKIAYNLFKDSGYNTNLHILPAKHQIPQQAKKLIQKNLYKTSMA